LNQYQEFIALSRYARWLEDENRRETWEETVERYIANVVDPLAQVKDPENSLTLRGELYAAITSLEVLPSMRALMTAGPALDRCNVAGYNCAYLPVDSPRAFDEAMYILMCGTGVGFSVEDRYVRQLPIVNEHFERTDTTIRVADSKSGWARGLRELVSLLYAGQLPRWDVTGLRPAGARLKTFGGRASGPEPLVDLFEFVGNIFNRAAGRRLTSLECHDIMCKIGEVVVVGGVRRSAMISLSDVTDERMRNAKHGNWWEQQVQRALSNNSAAYNERPDFGTFIKEWTSLYESRSGERGIFNRRASQVQAARSGRRDAEIDFGTNPCSEIILRPYQFCNLTEVVVRSSDTIHDLHRKVRLATILGTIQSTLTDFKYLRSIWKKNTEEERLLGVSLTGLLDHPTLIYQPEILSQLRETAVKTNAEFADFLGIAQSTAITCVKPSGTVSQLVDSASGIHPRWSPFYLRSVRADNKDPLTEFMKDVGIPSEPDVTKSEATTVFYFPQRAPDGAITRRQLSAIEHLELWKTVQEHWCEHKPSITVNVREDEWMAVGAWVWKHFDILSGVSFLPMDEHTYRQAPYQEITEAEYDKYVAQMPKAINWPDLSFYEKVDGTTGSQELACAGGVCEFVEIGKVT
jgi:ribonucleoside-diphosphate reductase alpha chain